MMLNPFRFVLQAVTVLLGTSSWPHYYASQTTHAHRLVAFGFVSSLEGDNFALDGLCLLHSNVSTWLLSSVTSPHVGESPAIRAPAERDFTSGLGSSIPGMMLNPFRFVLQEIPNSSGGVHWAEDLLKPEAPIFKWPIQSIHKQMAVENFTVGPSREKS
ncbi:hypothetical protein MRX96_028066 [Rhipicephalus microplus]